MTDQEIIDKIQKIREKNNDEWIKLERMISPGENWEEIREERRQNNHLKMNKLAFVFKRYPEKAKKIFQQITENDWLINVLSKELCE